MSSAEALAARAEALCEDMDLTAVRAWKAASPGRQVVGYLPVCAPVELLTAAGIHPVGILGWGETLEIIRGDAYFQSYICHLPRSIVELGVSGRLDVCDGFLFPSTCDVIRNLSGIWQLLFPEKYVKYLDLPQDFRPEMGGRWYRHELETLRSDLGRLTGTAITDADLWEAIRIHDAQRALLRELYDLRSEAPWKVPAVEMYRIQRAGFVLTGEAHCALLREYLAAVRVAQRPCRDNCRVVLAGAFCEQPPIGLLATFERAGCFIVDDDLLLGHRFTTAPVLQPGIDDPIQALTDAFLAHHVATSFLYVDDARKGAELVATCRARRAEGVIFCAPSFCDPALLDRPMLAKALDEAGIPHMSLKYAENSGQFQAIREQAGTFADALKLWGAPEIGTA
jgi:benzoyl-CoA reductase subunit C